VDALLCVSPAIYEEALEMGYPPAKLHQMPNAIDLDRFSPITADERAEARRRHGQSQASSVVLHLGWDWLRKGGDLMLGAAETMEGSDVSFLTVVEESREEPKVGLFETHENVYPIAPVGAVNELYAVADVFLSCSRSEGMPYALLEALARGLLVVATDLPVQRELLEGLPGARLVAPEPRAISGALAGLLELTPEQRSEHAAQARTRVARSHALGPWAERLVDLYDATLSGPAS
jgi:glycosyltransferase involved in cell wall biosynthesis